MNHTGHHTGMLKNVGFEHQQISTLSKSSIFLVGFLFFMFGFCFSAKDTQKISLWALVFSSLCRALRIEVFCFSWFEFSLQLWLYFFGFSSCFLFVFCLLVQYLGSLSYWVEFCLSFLASEFLFIHLLPSVDYPPSLITSTAQFPVSCQIFPLSLHCSGSSPC